MSIQEMSQGKYTKIFNSDVQLNKYMNQRPAYDYSIIAFNDKGQILTIVHPASDYIGRLRGLRSKAAANKNANAVMKYTNEINAAVKKQQDQDY